MTDLYADELRADDRAVNTFFCPGCERHVSVDNGCFDDMPELCDDCWMDVTRWRAVTALRPSVRGGRE